MTGPMVLQQNLYFLNQGLELLGRVDDTLYTASIEDSPRVAGIGPHLRHCLDFYLCFLRDLDTGRVDYDHRDRDRPIETSRTAGLETIRMISSRFRELGGVDSNLPLEVMHDPAPREVAQTSWHLSTVGRELRFLASHTVHHYALIAFILRTHGFEPGEEFGVAPSTLAFRESEIQPTHSSQIS